MLFIVVVVVIVLFILLVMLFESNGPNISRIISVARILPPSVKCSSFYAWSRMIQNESFLSFTNLSSPDVVVPSVPHLILCNHIRSHFALGSFLTMAGSVKKPSDIVCYNAYDDMFAISGIMSNILKNEITVDRELGKDAKKLRICQGIRNSLARGRNVIMFIDAHALDDPTKPIRTLYLNVLKDFPDVPKQLVEVLEPTGVNEFRFRLLQSSTSLSRIISLRKELLLSSGA